MLFSIRPTVNAPSFTTKSGCLANTQKRFGARCRHLQGISSELLSAEHINWFQTSVRAGVCRNVFLQHMHPF
jgi:hypothetical protein